MPTIGEKLLVLKNASELSLAEIARQAGYRGASSIQKYFNKDYNPKELPRSAKERIMPVLVGKGTPPIRVEEIEDLGVEGFSESISDFFHLKRVLQDYIQISPTERFGAELLTEGGTAIPLFRIIAGEQSHYLPAPKHVKGKELEGFYVTVGNMWPRFEEGEVVVFEKRRPATQGDDVLVTLYDEQELDGVSLIGRLYLVRDEEVHLDIFSPRDRIIIPRSSVINIKRITPRVELLPLPIIVDGPS